MKFISAIIGLFAFSALAADVPGGINRTAEGLPEQTYELMLSPSYTMQPAGAYLSSEVRFQPNQDFGAGLGFGAGEVGYHFGVNGAWYLLPDLGNQPAVSILGAVYLNRVQPFNYFVARVTPMVSKMIQTTWGTGTPYAGVHLTPSFRLSDTAANDFAVRAAVGSQFTIKALEGVNLFAEFNLSVLNSMHEVSLGLSYPFAAL